MEFKKILVVGGGTMGSGIAQVCAQKGMEVLLYDLKEDILKRALDSISWSVGKFIQKGKLKEDKDTIIKRIKSVTELKEKVEADIVIEAVFEKLDIKLEVFKRLDEIVSNDTLLASNTSAIPITELASATNRPENVVGLHFFNPVPMMDVVEVVRGISTSEQTLNSAIEFVKFLEKEPVVVHSDVPGFLLNRINLISYVEAIRLVEQGIGNVEEIDKGVKLAFGRRMGPFETGDLVGLDVSYNALMAIYNETKDLRYYPPQLLRRKVTAGHLGRKTGRGWYKYDKNGKKIGG